MVNDSILNSESNQLISMIKKTFTKVKYPGDNCLVNGQTMEHLEYKNAFHGRDWRYLSLEFVCPQYSGMSFFSAEAFRYYLPAYMILCIQNLEEVDVMSDYLVSALTLPGKNNHGFGEDIEILKELEMTPEELIAYEEACYPSGGDVVEDVEYFHERCDPLSFDQKQAVRAFLEWLVKYGDDCFDGEPETAIQKYWGKF